MKAGMRLAPWSVVACALWACSTPPVAPIVDEGGVEATDGSNSSAVPDAAAADGSSATAPDAAAVTECESVVDQVRAACAAEEPDAGRLCLYDATRPLCATGRTAFVSGLFHCLLLDACQTPSDPSGAGECEAQLIASSATSEDRALGAALCGCDGPQAEGCDAGLPAGAMGNLMIMKPADVLTLANCITATGCSGDGGGCAADLPPLFSCKDL